MPLQNPILIFILFVVLTISIYNETQSYEQYSSLPIDKLILSPHQDHQLMIVYTNNFQNITQQVIYDFSKNSQLCRTQTNGDYPFIAWPFNTGGLYIFFGFKVPHQPFISDTPCSDFRQLNQISSKGQLVKYKIRNTKNQSYLGFIAQIDRQTIFQYDFQKRTIQKSITIENKYTIWDYDYSSNGQYLYVSLQQNLQNQALEKIFVYDANSYQKLRQIPVNLSYMVFLNGNNDGKGWIGAKLDDSDFNYYNIDENGNALLIYTKGGEYVKFCPDDNQTMLILQQKPQGKTHLKVLNVTDGTIVQNFTLNLTMKKYSSGSSVYCNNKYLVIIDQYQRSHIFEVLPKTQPEPEPKPDPQPDNDSDSSFPTWAIILISAVSIVIIGIIVGYIIHKRKQNISGQYQHFTNQKRKSMSYKD